MSILAYVYVDGTHLLSLSDNLDPTFLCLFTRHERRDVERTRVVRPRVDEWDDGSFLATELVAQSKVLLHRLAAIGFGAAFAISALTEDARDAASSHERISADMKGAEPEFLEMMEKHVANLRGLTPESLRTQLREQLVSDGPDPGTEPWCMDVVGEIFRHFDPRLVLFFVADAFPDAEIVIDISELREDDWLSEPDEEPDGSGVDWRWTSTGPAIILAEGRSDIEILRAAVQVLMPHLEGYVRFADFDMKPEGGAGALARTLRAFISAGVSNHVIALFDNDTAGADAIRSFANARMPSNIRVLQYPALNSATSYPTLGPTGPAQMDVNGLAGGIELYLGDDVLTDVGGERRPVQWTGFVKSLNRYQGELVAKHELAERFHRKAEAALRAPDVRASQDWTALSAVLEMVLDDLGRREA